MRTLCNALEFVNDDRHLTDEGIAAREALQPHQRALPLLR
jgi:hypothetical protein